MRRLLLVALLGALAGCGGSSDPPLTQAPAPEDFSAVGPRRGVPTPSATASPRAVAAFRDRTRRICTQERRRVTAEGARLGQQLRARGLTGDRLELEGQVRLAPSAARLFARLRREGRPPPVERRPFLAFLDYSEAVAEFQTRVAQESLRGTLDTDAADARAREIKPLQQTAQAWSDRLGVAACDATR